MKDLLGSPRGLVLLGALGTAATASAQVSTLVKDTFTVRDAIDPSPTLTYSPASGSLFPVGTTFVAIRAKDASENSATCSFSVTVTSEAPPDSPGSGCGCGAGPASSGLVWSVLALLFPRATRQGRGTARSNAFRITLTCGLLAFAPLARAQAPQSSRRNVADVYASLCANCHGPKLEGALGPSLVDDTWKSGADDESIARSIREGQPPAGMPAFSGALSPQDIRALVIYIRERGAERRGKGTPIAKPAADKVVRSELHAFKLETVTEGLDTPWSVAFLPDGRMLVTEKAGRLRVVDKGRLLPEPILGTPDVWSRGQGGLLDVAVHPDYAKNGWIYLSYSDPGANDTAMTVVVRGKLREGRFVEQQTLFRAPAELYRSGGVHFGSRFVFDGKGHLFFSIGERGHKEDAQNLSRPNGKVHRIHEDGSIPKDNPFVGREGAMPSIWSYGNRNPQGLARHPVTGELWETEHGPRGGDELNRIEPGRNYGWPVITYGMNYDGTPMTDLTAQEGMQQPALHWTPSIAVCAADFYTGSRFPQWKNDLFVGALAAQEVRRLRIEGRKVVHQEVLFKDVGRVRDVVSAPDGYLYVAFNGPDRIARLVSAPGSEPASSKPQGAKP